MKNLLFLVIAMFSLSLFFSCGEENFEPYESGNSSQNLKLLPSEITKSYTDPNTGVISTNQIILDYNSKNQLISIQETLTGGYKNTYDIAYDIDGNVSEVSENAPNTSTVKYTYEYVDESTILEHVSTASVSTQTNTLTLNVKQQLTSKDDPNTGLITYGYDSVGNLNLENSNLYLYDNTKGWMSSVETPHWLFSNFGKKFPGTYNLINNVTDIDGNIYNYIEFNPAKYPVKITVSNNTELTIKYISAK